MIDRKEFAEELMLRESVRKAIKVIQVKRNKTKLAEQKQEQKLHMTSLFDVPLLEPKNDFH